MPFFLFMKQYLKILCLSLSITCGAQNASLAVEYQSIIDDVKDDYGLAEFTRARLLTNGSESVYLERLPDTVYFSKSGLEVVQQKNSFTYPYHKNLTKRVVTYRDRNIDMDVIAHVNYRPVWTLTPVTKDILGYKCQEAKGTYDCRNYTVYFAPDIPIPDGPYKFDGLPGLILEVRSDDGSVVITATKIQPSAESITNPFANVTKTVAVEEAAAKYRVKYEKMVNYFRTQDIDGGIPMRSIECYVK